MKREFNVVIERDPEGYYMASVPDSQVCAARELWHAEPNLKTGRHLCRAANL